jgi:hypothetical protein
LTKRGKEIEVRYKRRLFREMEIIDYHGLDLPSLGNLKT